MPKFRSLDSADFQNKRVLLRVDLNAPMENGKLADATRIERIVPTIHEIADKGGKVILRQRRETAGPAVAVRLTTDRSALAADGQDVGILKVEVVDAKGRVVPKAEDLVTFSVNGPGEVIGVGNGNPTSHESDVASQRKVFNGLAQAIVRTKRGQAGEMRVLASAPGLKPASLALKAG